MQHSKVLSLQRFVIAAAVALIIMSSVAADEPVAEPSLYSAAYLPPKPVVVVGDPLHYSSPYDGAVASTSTSVFRTPGHPGQVSTVHKTVETPYSSAHKADVRYTNDVQLPYHHYPAAVPYGYGPAAVPYGHAAAVPYGHGPAAVPYGYGHAVAVPYNHGPVAVPYGHGPAAVPYGYGHAAAVPYNHGPVTVPYGHGPTASGYSVSHASFSGPHGTHYSYRR
ncbi:cuticle protein 76-like [Metopolophium dirhodum]|uniref:cuticle protein 76-like n=1 Tax=Metopolophium dirhodum TaxID=44670 RepID=UPI00298FAD11|nr:cuticle protein 76-like [Metopolophium dirhodum]